MDYPKLLLDPAKQALLDRFLRYVKVGTTSDRHVEAIPSTASQWDLMRALEAELRSLGVEDVKVDDHCYLIARIPASPGKEGKPCVGFMAHVDTASDCPGTDVKPTIREGYDGKPIRLSEQHLLDPGAYPQLAEHVGDTIVHTDGSTLLGADDKAGIAEIMTAIELILADSSAAHGPLEIVFTPDEETGKGMDLFPLHELKSKACYTVDGERAGEIEAECFNAYGVKVKCKGKSIHIGAARGKFANATSMVGAFISMLPRSESPEATDGWYGYYAPLEVKGGVEEAELEVYLRDFTREGMDRRIEAVKAIAKAVEALYPLGSVSVDFQKQYVNMREKLDAHPDVLRKAEEALRRVGLEPVSKPIRGGTDGARLTDLGIPTPNLFTGGYNYHSRYEWASVSEMLLSTRAIVELVKIWAE
jgi:tripeptide aminopeptidase